MTWRRALSVALALALALPLLLVVYDRPLQLMPWRKRSAQPEAAERRSNPGPALAALGRGKGDGDGDGVDLFKGEPLLGEEHIFFVETSCALDKPQHVPYDSESGLRLSPRGACAVEAAASAHPTHRVYLVHTCDVQRRSLAKGAAPAYALAALSIPNVRLWAVPYALHFVGTPLQGWLASGALRASRWPVVHASDVLRFLLLWKYGGTYLDLDVLMLRSLGEEKNFGCAESPAAVSVGAFNFALDDPGRRVANACIAELLDYRPDLWSYNGPGAITRALKKVCNVQEVLEMTEEMCGGFRLLSTSTFYAIPWQNWNLFFTEESSEETMMMIDSNLFLGRKTSFLLRLRAQSRCFPNQLSMIQVPGMTEKKCGGFHLLPTSTFYAIPWRNWNLFFTEKSSEETMKVISKNLAVHVWNSRSHNTTVYTSSKQPYAQIARGCFLDIFHSIRFGLKKLTRECFLCVMVITMNLEEIAILSEVNVNMKLN
ncbi:Lactosylceramide 4-alpha-galactosyltransferase [Gryllus bimaculatus]|nr:Lactosylceramide 4-alpha-galactosyltransferase [Gryllus bimaculatus]